MTAPLFIKLIVKEPAAVASTLTIGIPSAVPPYDFVLTTTTSPAATVEFVTTNDVSTAVASTKANVVICPHTVLIVTPVLSEVIRVTAPPAPVE